MPLVERRYAEAMVDIADSKGSLDSYQDELSGVVEIFKSQAEFKDFLLDPQVKTDIKKDFVKKIFSSNINTQTLNFLMLLLDKGRIKFLPGIYDEFVRLADSKRNILNMTIISASPLDDSQIKRIKDKYGKIYNASHVKADIEIDNSLIGGVKVKIGDKVIDDSLKGRLESLKELLVQ